ncbi:hypothetical protein Plhal304r1_c005g0020281 [Plasmopara halstedii]
MMYSDEAIMCTLLKSAIDVRGVHHRCLEGCLGVRSMLLILLRHLKHRGTRRQRNMSVAFFGDGESYFAPSAASSARNMAVKRINDIIKKLDWKEVEATLLSDERDDADPGFENCEASLEDWERYVKTENQALMSRAMEFEDGRIYIVELPSGVHDGCGELFKVEMVFATGTRDHHLPDCSFGPAPDIGAICPGGMTWIEYHTLKVKVDVSRGWSYLNRKADQ